MLSLQICGTCPVVPVSGTLSHRWLLHRSKLCWVCPAQCLKVTKREFWMVSWELICRPASFRAYLPPIVLSSPGPGLQTHLTLNSTTLSESSLWQYSQGRWTTELLMSFLSIWSALLMNFSYCPAQQSSPSSHSLLPSLWQLGLILH